MTGNSSISCECNRFKPKLAFAGGCADMDVSGFSRFVRIEVETKWTDLQDRWHITILPQNSG